MVTLSTTGKLHFHTPSTQRHKSNHSIDITSPHRRKFTAPVYDDDNTCDQQYNTDNDKHINNTQLILKSNDIIDLYNTDDQLVLSNQLSVIPYDDQLIHNIQQSTVY